MFVVVAPRGAFASHNAAVVGLLELSVEGATVYVSLWITLLGLLANEREAQAKHLVARNIQRASRREGQVAVVLAVAEAERRFAARPSCTSSITSSSSFCSFSRLSRRQHALQQGPGVRALEREDRDSVAAVLYHGGGGWAIVPAVEGVSVRVRVSVSGWAIVPAVEGAPEPNQQQVKKHL